MAVKECENDGHCYYTFTDAWHIWGRWLLLAILVLVIILFVPALGFLMSKKRMSKGYPPVPGCGWMFPNPYKNTPPPSDQENMVPRYRAHDELREYQRQHAAAQQAQQPQPYSNFAPEFETTDMTDQSYPSEEKTSAPSSRY